MTDDKVQAELVRLRDENARLTNNLEELQINHHECQAVINNIRRDNTRLLEQREKLYQELDRLKAVRRNEMDERTREIYASNEELQHENGDLESRVSFLAGEIKERDQQIKEHKAIISKACEEEKERMEKVADLDTKNALLSQQVVAHAASLRELQQSYDRLVGDVKDTDNDAAMFEAMENKLGRVCSAFKLQQDVITRLINAL